MMVRTKRTLGATEVQRSADNDTEGIDGGMVRRLLQTNCWANAIDHRRDGLLSWKHYAALLLRDVSVSDVAEQLMPVLNDMARQVEDVIIGAREGRTPVSDFVTIEEWLVVWNEHFRHWTDPVREMLQQFAATPDAEHFVAVAMRSNPVVLLDFLLDAVVAHEHRLSLHQALCGQAQQLPWIYRLKWDYPKADTSLEAVCLCLYARYAARWSLGTGSAPDTVNIELDQEDIADEQFDPSAYLR
jgi:hypothetical protein